MLECGVWVDLPHWVKLPLALQFPLPFRLGEGRAGGVEGSLPEHRSSGGVTEGYLTLKLILPFPLVGWS